ncbi:hypothetical protein DFH06DRAFT_1143749 [Mycena polygramma]|nr:hypothetical protein DFH06DRAFT_1143749 [Mycena polygramma]
MHRGLYIDEIRGLIVSEFDTVAHSKELAALARTSTIFYDLALNALWEEQVTIMPLLRCMPVDIWELTGTLRRPLTSAEWERVFTYSRRVKLFRCRDGNGNPGDPDVMEVYKTLSQSVPGGYLMPNVETLICMTEFLGQYSNAGNARGCNVMHPNAVQCTSMQPNASIKCRDPSIRYGVGIKIMGDRMCWVMVHATGLPKVHDRLHQFGGTVSGEFAQCNAGVQLNLSPSTCAFALHRSALNCITEH